MSTSSYFRRGGEICVLAVTVCKGGGWGYRGTVGWPAGCQGFHDSLAGDRVDRSSVLSVVEEGFGNSKWEMGSGLFSAGSGVAIFCTFPREINLCGGVRDAAVRSRGITRACAIVCLRRNYVKCIIS